MPCDIWRGRTVCPGPCRPVACFLSLIPQPLSPRSRLACSIYYCHARLTFPSGSRQGPTNPQLLRTTAGVASGRYRSRYAVCSAGLRPVDYWRKTLRLSSLQLAYHDVSRLGCFCTLHCLSPLFSTMGPRRSSAHSVTSPLQWCAPSLSSMMDVA